ncbi:hypothetical protein HELRODRAFT_175903 [Helobdella robusta]|uniref:Uncharacterized protein n=1 Tax=Helobdella robusta TaxID=6412 RepID=T1F9U9_HELRO|nr:hypothetical protein HELRODRAFT_175903 [Helobdella robusta]ESO00464.1 hypothetical protein HELRODRAFT_175903 [Helobdella robusta]
MPEKATEPEDCGLKLCEKCRTENGAFFDNLGTGLKDPQKLVNGFVSRVETLEGAINELKEELISLSKKNREFFTRMFTTAGTKIELNNDRERRKNNIIIYNLEEKENNPKVSVGGLLKKIAGIDLETDVIEVSRMGRRSEENRIRPVLVQFTNANAKNLLFANCFRLKNFASFGSVIINHDLSKEDRAINKRIIEDKRRKIATKEDITK